MIGKVSIGKSFGGCVRYVLEKEGAEVLEEYGVRSRDAVVATQDFNAVRRENPKIKNAVWHTSISFAQQDVLDNKKMAAIARDYLKKMSLSGNQYLVVRHVDTRHEHMHVIVNRVGFDGKTVSDRWCKNRTANVCDKLEVKYGLTVAREQGNRRQPGDKVPMVKQAKADIRDAVEGQLQKGVSTMEKLKEELAKEGISLVVKVQSTGRVNGVSFGKDGIALKGSAVAKEFSYGRLTKLLAQNKDRGMGLSIG